MRKIIFLDIDGVLNNEIVAQEWLAKEGSGGGYGGFFEEEEEATKENVKWSHKNIDNLREIVQATNASIVISSDWRKHFSVKKFKEMFSLYGWKNAPIIDKTTVMHSSNPGYGKLIKYDVRGREIEQWLSENKDVTSYVIIDDLRQFLDKQERNFVNTNGEVGLTYKDCVKAIEILNK